MDNSSVRNILSGILEKELIYENEPMSRHTSFKVGGNAAFLVTPETEQQVVALKKALRDINHIVIGKGSNLLFPDEGYDGVVVELGSLFSDI